MYVVLLNVLHTIPEENRLNFLKILPPARKGWMSLVYCDCHFVTEENAFLFGIITKKKSCQFAVRCTEGRITGQP